MVETSMSNDDSRVTPPGEGGRASSRARARKPGGADAFVLPEFAIPPDLAAAGPRSAAGFAPLSGP